ncbi:TadE/TadG family type IV pilus assembly protein [Sanguibacter suaedae]|uniref:Pilus assembly protein n=1 Tax=Sanguibacter suaedae TaxID=2795737 RepID=A0A934M7F0_9MICO|nr:TadE/TadG family type IV pilus assembly protein [Sanguibacter suaedae]MBI9115332.1 pilus assembly protein [Sanguibacter suaedae]
MAVEMVVLVPVLLLVALLVVAGGRHVSTQGEVQALARDAARAASLERDTGSARTAAQSVVTQASSTAAWLDRCRISTFGGTFVSGGDVVIDVTCDVSLGDLGILGLSRTVAITGTSTAPIDTYRRTQ